MKISIITIGEPRLEYAKLGSSEYLKRLNKYHKLKIIHLRDSKRERAAKIAEEGKLILESAGKTQIIALDVLGKPISTPELSALLSDFAQKYGEITFVIGGPDGLSTEVKQKSQLLSLSNLTFPHDLAFLILCEALYRASSLERNEPYHRH